MVRVPARLLARLHVLRRAHRSQLLKFPAGVPEVLREVRDALRLAFSPALVLLQE